MDIQLTFNFQQYKADIKESLEKTAVEFNRIGFRLRRIKQQRAYEVDGFASFEDFCKKEFNLSKSTVSRMIAINKKYSVGGDSDELELEYKSYNGSQLVEMLTLPEMAAGFVSEDMSVSQIRELKDTFKDEDEIIPGQQSLVIDDLDPQELYLEVFKDNLDDLRAIAEERIDAREAADIIAPNGFKIIKYKMLILAFNSFPEGVKIQNRINRHEETITYKHLVDDIRRTVSTDAILEAISKAAVATSQQKTQKVDTAVKKEPIEQTIERSQTEPQIVAGASDGAINAQTDIISQEEDNHAAVEEDQESTKQGVVKEDLTTVPKEEDTEDNALTGEVVTQELDDDINQIIAKLDVEIMNLDYESAIDTCKSLLALLEQAERSE